MSTRYAMMTAMRDKQKKKEEHLWEAKIAANEAKEDKILGLLADLAQVGCERVKTKGPAFIYQHSWVAEGRGGRTRVQVTGTLPGVASYASSSSSEEEDGASSSDSSDTKERKKRHRKQLKRLEKREEREERRNMHHYNRERYGKNHLSFSVSSGSDSDSY